MAKKKEGKNITINQLAVMVNNGFESLKKEIRGELQSEIGSVRSEIGSLRKEVQSEIGSLREEVQSEIGSLREEMYQGFKMVNGSIERHGRRTEYHDDEIFEIKGRLKVVEKKLAIKPR